MRRHPFPSCPLESVADQLSLCYCPIPKCSQMMNFQSWQNIWKNKLQLNAQWIQSNLQWGPLLYNGHFFGGESIHWLLFKTLYNGHFRLSQRWSLWRGSMVVSFSFWKSSAVIKNITLGKFVWIWQFTFQTDVFATLKAQKLDLSYSLAIIKWL